MTTNSSSTTSSTENKKSQVKTNSVISSLDQKSKDIKTSGSESSTSTTGAKPERRRRKFSPLEKDISSRLFPGSNVNLRKSTSLSESNDEKKVANTDYLHPISEEKGISAAKSDAATSSSSVENPEMKLPQQEMQESSDQSSSNAPTIPKSDLNTSLPINKNSHDVKRKLDSNKDNLSRLRDSKRSRKQDDVNEEVSASSSPTLIPETISHANSPEIDQTRERNVKKNTMNTLSQSAKTPKNTLTDGKNDSASQKEFLNISMKDKPKEDINSPSFETQGSNPSIRGKEIFNLTSNMEGNKDNPRKHHILALLAHRRRLIERIIQCKECAKHKLEEIERQTEKETNSKTPENEPLEQKPEDSIKQPEKIVSDLKKSRNIRERLKREEMKEIEEFRLMSDAVSQTSKKQRSFQGSVSSGELGEKQRPPTLRRTSIKKQIPGSQGSDLVNDGRGLDGTPNSFTYSTVSPNSVANGNHIPNNALPFNSTSFTTPYQKSSQNDNHLNDDSLSSTFTKIPSSEKLKSLNSSKHVSHTINGSLSHTSDISPGPIPSNQILSLNTRLDSSGNQFSNNLDSTSSPSNINASFNSPSTRPQHIHNIYDKSKTFKMKLNNSLSQKKQNGAIENGRILPGFSLTTMSKTKEPNRAIRNSSTKNLKSPASTEIHSLREKRKFLLNKLVKLQQDQKKKHVSSVSKKDTLSPSFISSQIQSSTKLQNTSNIMRPWKKRLDQTIAISPDLALQPSRLPPHRKTHWNYLLEEMRWLATDFMEERKWKVSSASTLSNVILSKRNTILEKFYPFKDTFNASDKDVEHPPQTLFVTPTSSDITKAKKVANKLSIALTEHWEAMVGSGACVDEGFDVFERTFPVNEISKTSNDDSLQEKSTEGKTESEPTEETVENNNSCKVDCETSQMGRDSTISYFPAPISRFSESDDSFERMCRRINDLSKNIHEIKMKAEHLCAIDIEKAQNELLDCGFRLTTGQVKAVQFVENVWSMQVPDSKRKQVDNDSEKKFHFGCGAILTGESGSGKTICAGSLLWKYRQEGPQLVVCTPASLIQWRHEMRQFCGLKVFTLGSHVGSCGGSLLVSSSNFVPGLSAGDIVICDISSIHAINFEELGLDRFSLDDVPSLQMSPVLRCRWASVVIDLRFSQPGHKLCEDGRILSNLSSFQTPHLSLWQPLIENLQFINNERKRKLILRRDWDPGDDHFLQNKAHLSNNSNEMAKIFAFIFPASALSFYNPRRVFSWAKKCSQLKGKNQSKKNLDIGIRHELQLMVEKFQYFVNQPTLSDHSINQITDERNDSIANIVSKQSSTRRWSILKCKMGSEQRASYRLCCSYVRGALSANELTRSKHAMIAANAMMRLRRTCLHSDIWKILNIPVDFSSLKGDSTQQLYELNKSGEIGSGFQSSSAQPEIHYAQQVIDGSAKISELLRILVYDANIETMINIEQKPTGVSLKPRSQLITKSLESSNPLDFPKTDTYQQQKKVLILATLPEAQLLIHNFLDACCIAHEMLTTSNKNISSFSEEMLTSTAYLHGFDGRNLEFTGEISSTLEWASIQQSLSRFDKRSGSTKGLEYSEVVNETNVLVSSPATLGGTNGGISASAADIIVSFDEDWSGRGMKFLDVIIRKSNIRTYGKTSQAKLIKLLCEDSCEECFFSTFLSATISSSNKSLSVENENETLSKSMNDSSVEKDKVKENSGEVREKHCQISYQTDSNGYIVGSYDLISEKSELVLGRQILMLRGKDLSEILCTPLTRDFATGKKPIFLPFIKPKNRNLEQNSNEMAHVIENNCRPTGSKKISDSTNRATWYEEDCRLGYELAHAEAKACPLTNARGHNLDLDSNLHTHGSCLLQWLPVTAVSTSDNHHSNNLATRKDLKSMPVRLYCESFGRNAMLVEKITNPVPTDSSGGDLEKTLADSWRKSGLGCSPGLQTMPLLCYNANEDQLRSSSNSEKKKKKKMENMLSEIESPSKRRKNNSLSSFSSYNNSQSQRVRDGNSGLEPLVYVPPMFPGLLASCYTQQNNQKDKISTPSPVLPSPVLPSPVVDMSGPPVSTNFGDHFEIDTAIMDSSDDILDLSDDLLNSAETNILAGVDELYPLTPAVQPSDQDEMNPHSNNMSSVLMEGLHFGDDSPEINPPKSGVTEGAANDSSNGKSPLAIPKFSNGDPFPVMESFPYLSRQEENDFENEFFHHGLLGHAAVNLQIDSIAAAVKVPTETARYKFWRDPFEPDLPALPSDSEESMVMLGAGTYDDSLLDLDSVLLFVKRNAKNVQQPTSSQQLGTRSLSPTPYGARGTIEEPESSANRVAKHDRVKSRLDSLKIRKKLISQIDVSYTPGIPVMPVSSNAQSSKKEPEESLYEHFEKKFGPSPLVIELPESSKVGDCAKSLANSQRASLRKNNPSPTSVDFGPFQSGYLASKDGMSGICPPSSLVGTSLPMGVKLTSKENGFDMQPWTKLEDLKLKEAAANFFPNWNIISQIVSDSISECKMAHLFYSNSSFKTPSKTSRSPRQCQDRLQTLSEIQFTMAKELDQANRFRKDICLSEPSDVVHHILNSHSGALTSSEMESNDQTHEKTSRKYDSLLLPSTWYKSKSFNTQYQMMGLEGHENTDSEPNKIRRKRFIHLSSASTKRERPSIPIPGYTGDNSTPLTIVPSHVSHVQAVKDVVAQSNSGTFEMWPLPLLDLADKQRFSQSKSGTHQKSTSYPQPPTQQTNSISAAPQHRPVMNTVNSVGPIQQHAVQHQARQPHGAHSYQQTQKMPVNQQQPMVQQTRPHVPVNYSKQQSPIKNRPISNQHDLVKQAARAAALAPSTNNRNMHNKSNVPGKVNAVQPLQQRPIPMSSARDFATTNDPLSIHASMSSNNGPQQLSPVNTHGNPPIGISPLRGNAPSTTSNQSNCK